MLMAMPIAAWELSVGIYMTVKGFKTPDTQAVPAAHPAELYRPSIVHGFSASRSLSSKRPCSDSGASDATRSGRGCEAPRRRAE